MLKRTKYALSAVGVLVAMTMAIDASAQNVLSVSSGVQARAREHGQTELAGGITITVEAVSTTSGEAAHQGTLTIDYGVPITNRENTAPPLSNIVITGTGCFLPANRGDLVISGSIMTIHVGLGDGQDEACTDTTSIDVSGVRLQIAEQGLSDGVDASIGASGDFRLAAGASRVTVINAVVDELGPRGLTTNLNVFSPGNEGVVVLERNTGDPMVETGVPKGSGARATRGFELRITENSVDSFQNAQLELDFSGIPEGATITLDAWASESRPGVSPDTTTRVVFDATADNNAGNLNDIVGNDEVTVNYEAGADGVTAEDSEAVILMMLDADGDGVADNLGNTAARPADTSATPPVTALPANAQAGGSLNPIVTDRITLQGTIAFDDDETTYPLDAMPIQVTVDVGPVGNAFGRRGAIIRDPAIRFASDKSSAVTVIDIESNRTEITIPYATTIGAYDTGIAVANTNLDDDEDTTDPAGTITFDLYMNGEHVGSYETMSGSPGAGLNDRGELEAGSTYAVALSQIMEAGEIDGPFSGYVVITTDFRPADANVFISDFAGFAATGTVRRNIDEQP